jgi:hypothetical protein
LQEYFGLFDKSGTYIFETVGDRDAQYAKKGDVITAINGMKISASGTVKLPKIGAVSIRYIASTQQVGKSLELILISGGKEFSVNCKLNCN